MIAFGITETDFGIGALVVIICFLLVYRLLRRDSGIRLTRIGVFLERERYDDDDEDEEEEENEVNTEILWPKKDDS